MLIILALVSPAFAWQLPDWNQREKLNFTNLNSTVGNSTFAVNLTWKSGMKSDFSDVRFTWINQSDSSEQNISYWNETQADGSWALFWNLLPELYGGSNTTVYAYWDNTAANSTADGNTTFMFFDDFNNIESIGYPSTFPNKWEAFNGITWSMIDSTLICTGNNCWLTELQNLTLSEGLIARFTQKFTETTGDHWSLSPYFSPDGATDGFSPYIDVLWSNFGSASEDRLISCNDPSCSTTTTISNSTYFSTGWRVMETSYSGSYTRWKINGTLIGFANDADQTAGVYAHFYQRDQNSQFGFYSVRKFIDNEPSVTQFSAESQASNPTVSILNPENVTYGIPNVTINFTAYPDIDQCWYNLDGGSNVSLTSCGNTTLAGFSDMTTRTLNVYANNTAGLEGSASVTFSFDLSVPNVNITSPEMNTLWNVTSIPVLFTATNTVLISQCWYVLDGGSDVDIPSCNNFSLPGISAGGHVFTIYANDSVNTTGSHQHNFTADFTPPSLSVQSPLGSVQRTGSFNLRYTTYDVSTGTDTSSCTYQIDSGSVVPVSLCHNVSVSYSTLGSHNMTVSAKDLAGNYIQVVSPFTINNVIPSVAIQSPAGTVTGYNVSLRYTASSVNSLLCSYAIGNVSFSLLGCLNDTFIATNGPHLLILNATDTFGSSTIVNSSFTVAVPSNPIIPSGTPNLIYLVIPILGGIVVILAMLSFMVGAIDFKTLLEVMFVGILIIIIGIPLAMQFV